ncbi:unnamed protein product [Alternaria alternata]
MNVTKEFQEWYKEWRTTAREERKVVDSEGVDDEEKKLEKLYGDMPEILDGYVETGAKYGGWHSKRAVQAACRHAEVRHHADVDLADSGTDEFHRASIARSTAPEGPWLPAQKNLLVYNGGHDVKNLTVQSTSHADFVDGLHGEWYASYLARRQINDSLPLGRENFLTTVRWQNNWPVPNGGDPTTLDGDESVAGTPSTERNPTLFCRAFHTALPSIQSGTDSVLYMPRFPSLKLSMALNEKA